MSGKFDSGLSAMGGELKQLRDLVSVWQAERAEQYGKIDARLSRRQRRCPASRARAPDRRQRQPSRLTAPKTSMPV